MRTLGLLKAVRIISVFCAATAIASSAQILTTLHTFYGPDGLFPEGLVQATDGNFYGVTSNGGYIVPPIRGDGTVFRVTPAGTLTTLHSFDGADGILPVALVQGSDGSFYGTTQVGGAHGSGTVFKITSSGTLTTLHSFDGADGWIPYAGLVEASDGNFYGTTGDGGAYGRGTVFTITTSGTLTTLHSFDGIDGFLPQATLIQASDGNLYGTTLLGGASSNCNGGCGTVFKITPSGTLTTLYSFEGTDGSWPYAGLVQATDGNFYGTTGSGGDLVCDGGLGCGTVFKITPAGALTTLHNFEGTDGADPEAALIQATDGNFYGTTYGGPGTVFKITASGTLTTLYTFCSQAYCSDGDQPTAGLTQATDGSFYGTTSQGGAKYDGNIFRLVPERACPSCPFQWE